MKVKLERRWGSNQAGESVSVDDEQGRWLVNHNFGTAAGLQAPVQVAAGPGADGPDQLAGGDATRLSPPAIVKGERRENGALPVPGSPVQYNAGVAPVAPQAADSSRADRPKGSGEATQEPTSKVSSSGRKRQA